MGDWADEQTKELIDAFSVDMGGHSVIFPDVFAPHLANALRAERARLAAAEHDLSLNKTMLAKQCDLARDLETCAHAAERERDAMRAACKELNASISSSLFTTPRITDPVRFNDALTTIRAALAGTPTSNGGGR